MNKDVIVSVIIPALNEEATIRETILGISGALRAEKVAHELIVVHGSGRDRTGEILTELQNAIKELKVLKERPPFGFGSGVRQGMAEARGTFCAIMMADGSESPADLLTYLEKIQEGYDCVFGSRFIKGGRVVGYPRKKLFLNRVFNIMVQILFLVRFNDFTNAFKIYRTSVIRALEPQSVGFSLTVELPLKAIARKKRYAVVPVSWINRKGDVTGLGMDSAPYYLAAVRESFFHRWFRAAPN